MAEDQTRGSTFPRIDGHVKAHTSTALPAPFKAPNYEQVLGEKNPFEAEHRLHAEWERRRTTAAFQAAQLSERLLAEFRERIQAEPARRWTALLEHDLAWWRGLFDIRAEALMLPMAPSAYAEILSDHAEAILSAASSQGRGIDDELAANLLHCYKSGMRTGWCRHLVSTRSGSTSFRQRPQSRPRFVS